MWQKCPICEGSGVMFVPTSSGGEMSCTTCNGHKIIDTVLGFPPGFPSENITQVTITDSSTGSVPDLSNVQMRYAVFAPKNKRES